MSTKQTQQKNETQNSQTSQAMLSAVNNMQRQQATNEGGTAQTQTLTRDPYAPIKPGLIGGAGGITEYMLNPASAQAYTGPRVQQMSDATAAGIDDLTGAEGARRAQDYYTRTLGGDYLNAGNPYTQALTDATMSRVMPAINSRVSAAGMAPGSSVDQALVARGVADATAAPLFQNYEAERQRQMAAAGALPGVSGMIGQQGIMGGQLAESYGQRNLDADRAAFEEARTAGLRPFAEGIPLLSQIGAQGGSQTGTNIGSTYNNLTGLNETTGTTDTNTTGTSSGTTSGTTTTSNQPSPLQIALGAGMMGASMFGGGGMFPGALSNLFGGGAQAAAAPAYTPTRGYYTPAQMQ